MLHRRAFFKAGIVGSVVLGGAYSITRSIDFKKHSEYTILDQDDVSNLLVLSSVILKGSSVTKVSLSHVVKGVEEAILGLPPMVQKEIKELLLLLKWRPLRWLTGRNSKWSEASQVELEQLLASWRLHRLQIFRGAYAALCELVNASFYAAPENWKGIGYPGPPELDR